MGNHQIKIVITYNNYQFKFLKGHWNIKKTSEYFIVRKMLHIIHSLGNMHEK